MTATIEKSPCKDALTDEWYNRLLEAVEYQCSFCDAVHTDVKDMEEKVRAAYSKTASSLKGIYDIREIATRWYGMYAFSTEVLEHVRFVKRFNQICGVDLGVFLEYQKAAFDR